MASHEREAELRNLLEGIRAARTPCIPSEFCDQAGITRPALANYPDIAKEVNLWGWKTAPERMRGPRPGEEPAARNARKGAAAGERLRREHEEMTREIAALRGRLAAAEKELTQAKAQVTAAADGLAARDRIIEHLLTRAVRDDATTCRQVEAALTTLRAREEGA